MVRKAITNLRKDTGFKLRGEGATRIEALSDGVFAIAIAMLLISTDVPDTFSELQDFMYDFIPFGATIALLMIIWFQHYIFFQRYGLQDSKSVTLNTVLLFLILFYVYPLKFLFQVLFSLFSGLIGRNQDKLENLFTETMPIEDGPTLMIIYGVGGMCIFITLAAMYFRAWIARVELELSELEEFDTRWSIFMNLAMASIPLVSIAVSFSGIGGRHTFTFAGMTYWLYPILMPIMGSILSKRRKKYLDSNE